MGGSPPILLTVKEPFGDVLAFRELPANEIPLNSEGWVSFDFPEVSLNPGERYHITLSCGSGGEYIILHYLVEVEANILGVVPENPYLNGFSNRCPLFDWCFRTFVDITPEIELEFEDGFGVTVVVTNTGEVESLNIEWSLEIDGFILFQKNHEGIIASLPAGGKTVISTGFVFGFGPRDIEINVGKLSNEVGLFMIGPIVIL